MPWGHLRGNGEQMSDVIVDLPADHDAQRRPNVVDVGDWLNSAKVIRRELADYVPEAPRPGARGLSS